MGYFQGGVDSLGKQFGPGFTQLSCLLAKKKWVPAALDTNFISAGGKMIG